jgi:hypothetical protein
MRKKYTVYLPITLEAEVEADSAETAAKAISRIVTFNHRWSALALRCVDIIGWRPEIEEVTGPHCITLREIEVYANLDQVQGGTAAATA